MSRILIIGYGSPLRGDDGAGWQIAERLQETLELVSPAHFAGSETPKGLDVLVRHQLTPDLAETISGADRVLFIDAAEGDQAGYHIEPVVPTELVPGSFTHNVNPSVLLALVQALYGKVPQADALIVTGVAFGYAEHLSPAVAALIPDIVVRVTLWGELL